MSYIHLTARERTALFYLRQQGRSIRSIARQLGRSHTTLIREIKRNSCAHTQHYRDDLAQEKAMVRRQQPRHFRKKHCKPLMAYVTVKIQQDWSPELIAQRIVVDHPRSSKLRVSHECIYQWVFQDATEGGKLFKHLPRRHRKRRRQPRYGAMRGAIPGRVGIENRPAGATNRSRFGHWEGDTIEGKKGTGGIATHVERKSRLLIASKLCNHTAKEMAAKTIQLFQGVPECWRRSLTVDNGKEFADFKQIQSAAGIDVFFSNPYSPWERGSNEQTNGLLRFYFPKGIDWTTVSESALANAVNRINNRPRKCLDYRTPLEVYNRYFSGAL